MKTVIWSFLFCLLLATNASAQPGPRDGDRGWGPPSPEDRVELLKEALNLDDKQSAKLLEILSSADAQKSALRKKHMEQIHQDMCALKKSTTGQVKSVLTPEQSAEFDKLMLLKAHMQEQRKRHHFHHQRGKDGQAKGGQPNWPPMDCEESSP